MKWLIGVLLGAAVGCGAHSSAPRATSASGVGAPRADFADYRTFSFGPANPPPSNYRITPRALEVQQRLTTLVRGALEKRGYSESSGNPDLVIKVSAGSGQAYRDETLRSSQELVPSGVIGIDAYDGRSGVTVWHGSGQAQLEPQQPIDDALLASGVERILSDFPARRRVATASN